MLVYNSATSRFLDVNTAAMQQYGYTLEEFLQMEIHDIRSDNGEPQAANILKMPALNRFYDSGVVVHKKKTGDIFQAQIFSYDISFNGRIARAMIVIDVKNKQAPEEQAEELNNILSYQQQRIYELISLAHEVKWSTDAENFLLLEIAPSCCNLCGFTAEELMNGERSLISLVHPDDRRIVTEAHNTLIETGAATFECRLLHKDGSTRFVINEAHLQFHENGIPSSIECITIDITQLRNSGYKHYEVLDDNNIALERINEGFFSVDHEWKFTFVNRQLENMLQRSREELLEKSLWDIFPQHISPKLYREYHRATIERASVHFEEFSPLFGKWFTINAYPTHAGLTVYMRDITEERKQSVKIQAQTDKLREIAWIQSHKVRGPVASILGLVELFNKDNIGDPANKEILDNIKMAAGSLDEIIKEIVDKTNIMEI